MVSETDQRCEKLTGMIGTALGLIVQSVKKISDATALLDTPQDTQRLRKSLASELKTCSSVVKKCSRALGEFASLTASAAPTYMMSYEKLAKQFSEREEEYNNARRAASDRAEATLASAKRMWARGGSGAAGEAARAEDRALRQEETEIAVTTAIAAERTEAMQGISTALHDVNGIMNAMTTQIEHDNGVIIDISDNTSAAYDNAVEAKAQLEQALERQSKAARKTILFMLFMMFAAGILVFALLKHII